MDLRMIFGILLCIVGLAGGARADQFHYQNVLLGDRAMGLGGAFTAVADDASGMFYNPAGLAFALSNDISGSANAFYKRKVTYKKTIGDDDFVENSAGSMAPFFGGLQKVDNMIPGVAVAFGLFSRDSELKDQDDNISATDLGIERFHRTVNIRANTGGYGIAFAKRLVDSLAMGLSITYLAIEELVQEYQDAKTFSSSTNQRLLTQNIRQRLEASALEIGLGFQYSITPQISVGLNIKIPTMLDQSFENGQETTTVDTSNGFNTGSNTITRSVVDQQKEDNPLGTWPSEYRLGFAWFATTSLLWTIDAVSYSEAKGDLALFEREAVTNFATGVEYYITPPLPIRFGYYTNNDARPDVKSGEVNQPDHIDYQGVSLFLAWVQPNSQVAIGGTMQQGTGKAQKLSGSEVIQDVEAVATTFAVSATHNF